MSDAALGKEAHRVAKAARAALATALATTNPAAVFDPNTGYATDVEMNLLPGVSVAGVEAEFGAGAGNELAGKMRAPWSSSALVVNSFAPWRDATTPLRVAGVDGLSTDFAFEAKCPNGVARIPPHLDVLLTHGEDVVAVESKLIEYLNPTAPKVAAAAYLALKQKGGARASSRWFGVLDRLDEFRLLDAYQLVKHYLGLRLTYPARALTLVYLFWEPVNPAASPVFAQHRSEVSLFEEMVADDSTCTFKSERYPNHWDALGAASSQPEWLEAHLEQLRSRYRVPV